jgi:hypothetical protein
VRPGPTSRICSTRMSWFHRSTKSYS